MKLITHFSWFILMVLAPIFSSAQSEEAGIFVGGSYYLGDLNPGKQFYKTKFTPGLLYRHNFKDHRWVMRLQFIYGRVEAYDEDSKIQSDIDRNLDFQSSIIEFGPVFELNFLEYEMGSKTNFGNRNKKNGTACIFAGLTYFRMKPLGRRGDDLMELQPLGTEGQGIESVNSKSRYKLNQISIPIGVGVKFNLSPRFAFSLEYGLRKTFTDYLDDVSGTYVAENILLDGNGPLTVEMANKSGDADISTGQQRGNSAVKDWYVFSGLILTYRLQRPGTCSNW
ncbi:MAG: hypothetical protein JKY54_07720 [Flavobacteriales bacterium]|nr:hypothetical protein [Flavobacteriales bacterium]